MQNTADKRKNDFVFYLILFFCLLFCVRRDLCMTGAVRGLSFCISTVIPAVFPFSAVCKLLVRTVAVSPPGVILTGLVCGAPTGAYMCTDLYKNGHCDRRTAQLLCAVTNGMTPTFVIGFVGIYCLNNAQKGVFVYLICSFSALLYVFVSSKHIRLTTNCRQELSFFSAFTESVTESIYSVIFLCGFTVFFSVICEFFNAFFSFLPASALSFIFLLNEMITGILQSAPLCAVLSERMFFSLMCAFTSFSGICMHLQVSSVLSSTGLSVRPFVIGKCIQSLTSFAISYIVYGIIFG